MPTQPATAFYTQIDTALGRVVLSKNKCAIT